MVNKTLFSLSIQLMRFVTQHTRFKTETKKVSLTCKICLQMLRRRIEKQIRTET